MKNSILFNYITVTEFARKAWITPQAVRKMIKKRRLKAVMMGHQYLIKKVEFVEYTGRKL